jgi:hypothetical protein
MSARTPGVSGFSPKQLFFTFVPNEARQELNELWRTHFERADANAARRAQTERKKISLRVIDGKTLSIDWRIHRALLDLPLVEHETSDLDIQSEPEQEELRSMTVFSPEADALPDRYDWSENDIRVLHEGVLVYSLNLLKSKGNAEEKYDILRWIWAPDIFCWVSRPFAGANKYCPIFLKQLPFTFVSCCALSGYDADRLRSGLAHVLRPVLKQLGIPTSTTQ